MSKPKKETPIVKFFLPYIVSDYQSFLKKRDRSMTIQAVPIFTQVIERLKKKTDRQKRL